MQAGHWRRPKLDLELRRTASWVGALSWTIGPVFLALSLRVWSWGVRHYTSTGS